MKIFQNEKGQALLIIVLVMVVALTVTLSIVSRSVINLKTSVDQTSSQKALVAAEAGIEQVIKNASVASGNPITLGNSTSYQATVSQLVDASATSFLVYGGNLIAKDEGGYIWLSQYDAAAPWSHPAWPDNAGTTKNLIIYWGSTTDICSANLSQNTAAALEIVLISGTTASPLATRYALDPCSVNPVNRAGSNHFTAISKSTYNISNKNFAYTFTIPISKGLLLRVIPLYASTYIAAKWPNGNALPPQGQIISSIGSSGSTNTSNPTVRKISVYQGFPQLPAEFFPYSLLSP